MSLDTGPRQVKNINVYLAPLIEDLQELWKGFQVVDMSKPIGSQQFMVRGILAWTIHDYPGYGFCSGKYDFQQIMVFSYFIYIKY